MYPPSRGYIDYIIDLLTYNVYSITPHPPYKGVWGYEYINGVRFIYLSEINKSYPYIYKAYIDLSLKRDLYKRIQVYVFYIYTYAY